MGSRGRGDQYVRFVIDIPTKLNKQQKELLTLNEKVDQQKTSVELYKLKERIALVYTNILFFNGSDGETEFIIIAVLLRLKKTNFLFNI